MRTFDVTVMLDEWRSRYDPLLGPWRIRPLRWMVSGAVEWKPQDLWIGAFWKHTDFDEWRGTDLWICLIPCVPLHLWWFKRTEAPR